VIPLKVSPRKVGRSSPERKKALPCNHGMKWLEEKRGEKKKSKGGSEQEVHLKNWESLHTKRGGGAGEVWLKSQNPRGPLGGAKEKGNTRKRGRGLDE